MGKILEEIHEITVVGDGLMGHGISQVFAQKDYSVTLYDLNRTILERALSQIRSNLETFVEVGLQPKERGREVTSGTFMQSVLGRIRNQVSSVKKLALP